MKERPIIFSTPMVRALRAGIKTQTRRTRGLNKINEAPDDYTLDGGEFDPAGWTWHHFAGPVSIRCPYGVPGDRLWTRETWTGTWLANGNMHVSYAADGAEEVRLRAPSDYVLPKVAAKAGKWVSPLFLPRWASRDTLEVVSVRPERLNAITEADAEAEGIWAKEYPAAFRMPKSVSFYWGENGGPKQFGGFNTAVQTFEALWNTVNGAGSWYTNPWVWRVEFKRIPELELPSLAGAV